MPLISIHVHRSTGQPERTVRRRTRRGLVVTGCVALAFVAAGGLAAATGNIPSTPSTFTAVSPVKVLNKKVLVAPTATEVVVAGGTTSVPADATSVEVSVNVSGGTTAGTLEMYAYTIGTQAPAIQWTVGQAETTQVSVPVGTGGKVTFKNLTGSVTVTANVIGYYEALPSPSTTYTTTPTSASWLWNSQYIFETGSGSYTEYFTRYDVLSTRAITQAVLDGGTVQVYFTPSTVVTPGMWVPLPYQFDSSFGFTYNITYVTSPGQVTLMFYFIQTDPTATLPTLSTFPIDTYHFKVVVTPGSGSEVPATAQQPVAPQHVICAPFPGGKRCHP